MKEVFNPFKGEVCVLLRDGQSDNGLSIVLKKDWIQQCDATLQNESFIREGSYEELSEIMDKTSTIY